MDGLDKYPLTIRPLGTLIGANSGLEAANLRMLRMLAYRLYSCVYIQALLPPEFSKN